MSETTSSEVRAELRKQLNDVIATHETISNYMIKKGYYNAYDMSAQLDVALQVTDAALNLTGNNG